MTYPPPDDQTVYSYTPYLRAFEIFRKYPHQEGVRPEHDEVWAGPDPLVVSEEDLRELRRWGWSPSWENECFHRFE